MSIKLTKSLIEAGATGPSGYKAAQLKILGVGWPPPAGWKQALVGKTISKADYQRFLQAKSGAKPAAVKEKKSNQSASGRFYVVWAGFETGIFTDWASCKKQIDGFTRPLFKKYASRAEAEAALAAGPDKSSLRASQGQQTDVFTAGEVQSDKAGTGKTGAGKTSAKKKTAGLTAEQIAAMPEQSKIFCDGACRGNPGPAGSGVTLYRDNQVSELWYGLHHRGTNNSAELNALYQSLLLAQRELTAGRSVAVLSDSKYSLDCLKWAPGWAKKGWVTASKQPVKNRELVEQLYALYQAVGPQISLHHCPAHVGIEGNELSDRLAVLAVQERVSGFERFPEPVDIPALLASAPDAG